MFGWFDNYSVRDFIGIILFTFFFPIAFMSGLVSGVLVLEYLYCDVAKLCEGWSSHIESDTPYLNIIKF